jgi:hypothetical protein
MRRDRAEQSGTSGDPICWDAVGTDSPLSGDSGLVPRRDTGLVRLRSEHDDGDTAHPNQAG